MAVRGAPPAGLEERDIEGVRALHASGDLDLDLGTAAELCARLDAMRDARRRRVLIDLTKLRFCDSTGLRALIGAVDEFQASAGRVVVVPPADGAVARIFALAGATEFLPLRATVDGGLAALASTDGS